MNFTRSIFLALFIVMGLMGCQEAKKATEDVPKHSVEIVAKDFTFDGPTEIKSGWQTVKFVNAGHAPHFFLLNKLPDSIEYTRYVKEITRPFDVVFDSLKAGMSQQDAGALLGSLIPSWYFTSVKQMGGTGIVDTGMNAWVSMRLDPGTYVMECYIKEKGVFHTTLGMIRPIEVLDDNTAMKEPKADVELTLTNFNIASENSVSPGWNTIAVHFEEHPEIGLGNDVHVIEMKDDTDMKEVGQWLNWMVVEGLEPPAPAKFLGGTQEMPLGSTSYFHIKLDPGTYAWVSESAAARGMYKQFEVEEEKDE